MVYIETPFENYDLTGLSMLWHYRDWLLVSPVFFVFCPYLED